MNEDDKVEYSRGLEIEEFTPEVKATEVDITTIKIETKAPESIRLNPVQSNTEIKSSKTKIDIGRWSEEFIYKLLQENQQFSEVTWENQNEESFKPYDFKVIEDGIIKFIEVKGTPSKTKEIIYLSKNEWDQMFKNGENYSIYRLYNAGTRNPNVEIFNNPSDLIVRGVILPNPISLQI